MSESMVSPAQTSHCSKLTNYTGIDTLYRWYTTNNIKLGHDTEFKLLDKVKGLIFKPYGHPQLPSTYEKESKEGKLAEMIQVEVGRNQFINTLKLSDGNPENKKLVMAHGFGVGLAIFYKNLEPLVELKGWDIYLIDWLGMGLSSRPKFSLRPRLFQSEQAHLKEAEDFFVESFEIWRQKLNINEFTFLGHSLGGYLASVYSLKYPEKVNKLILASPVGIPQSPYLPDHSTQNKIATIKQQKELDVPSNSEIDVKDIRGRVPRWVPFAWDKLKVTPQYLVRLAGPYGSRLVDGYVTRRFQHLETVEQGLVRDYLLHTASLKGSGEYALGSILSFGAFARDPLVNRLPNLQVPVTFVYGDNDWMDHRHALKVIPNLKVKNRLQVLNGVGHQLFIENPAQFNRFLVKELETPY